jgi:hypothetical protein
LLIGCTNIWKKPDVEKREFVEAFPAFNELAAKYDGYEVW